VSVIWLSLFATAEVSCGVAGAWSLQEEGVGVTIEVKVTVTLALEPRGIAGLSLVSEAVKVSAPGFGLFELTVKLTFPFESVVAVAVSEPTLPPLITNPESPELVKVTVSPDIALFESSFTVIETVAVVDPSAGIEPELTEMVELLVFALLFANAGTVKRTAKKKREQIRPTAPFFIRCISRMSF
jgi:hypothetical protein